MSSKSLHRVGILGSGTCRLSSHVSQNSGFVRCSTTELLIIDVGPGVPSRTAALNLLDGISAVHFHISHLHIDHLMGIYGFLQAFAWSDDKRDIGVKQVTIRCSEQVGSMFNQILDTLGRAQIGIGLALGNSVFGLDVITYPNEKDWNYELSGIPFLAAHIPTAFNHGLGFELNGVRYGFTCDASVYSPDLVEFLRRVDVGVFDCGHLSNIWDAENGWRFDPSPVIRLAVETQTPVLIATHHYLRDYQTQLLSEEDRQRIISEKLTLIADRATALGYKGKIIGGYDLMPISDLLSGK